jgi:hypothetical protein
MPTCVKLDRRDFSLGSMQATPDGGSAERKKSSKAVAQVFSEVKLKMKTTKQENFKRNHDH